MTLLMAAIDDTTTTRSVLHWARRLARFLDAQVVAVHVQEQGSGAIVQTVADEACIRLHIRHGDVCAELTSAAAELHAAGIVVGARSPTSRAEPAGHVALSLAQHGGRPVVVVPPTSPTHVDGALRRVLVAVEGNGESAALGVLARTFGGAQMPEIVVLHVFEPDQLPPFADSPVHTTDAWAHEFVERATGERPANIRLETRVGDAPGTVREATRDLGVDLVAMGWHGDLSPGRARIVREMLTTSKVPVLLVHVPLETGKDAPGAAPSTDRPTQSA